MLNSFLSLSSVKPTSLEPRAVFTGFSPFTGIAASCERAVLLTGLLIYRPEPGCMYQGFLLLDVLSARWFCGLGLS